MRRRIGFLVLVIAVVVGARLLFRRPVDVELELRFGANASAVHAVALVISDERERVVRDVALSFAAGAPPVMLRHVPLPPGHYTIAARVDERLLSRPLTVVESGRYPLELQ